MANCNQMYPHADKVMHLVVVLAVYIKALWAYIMTL